ncbi:MAG TPA: M23 family metallopeptidase [Ignavibacteriaceae bacterium]|nr:M23 family metallopeptidase [Ignavibacteriaceae bacterium]
MDLKEEIKRIFSSLRKLKSISILFLPDYGGADTKTFKFGLFQIISLLVFYSAIIAIMGFLLLGLTPLKDMVFPGRGLDKSEVAKITELNARLNEITKEFQELRLTNERLKFAIGLGDSSLLKSINKDKDSIQKKRKKNPFGGNIFAVVSQLFQEKQEPKQKTYYFSKPSDSFISRKFEPGSGHMGIDFVVKTGTPVYAAANGYVIFADYTTKDGYMLIINHNNGYITIYKHCSVLLKKARDLVFQGETIALSGNTGEISTGPHLHFEIWKDGEPIDPAKLLINY